MAKRSPTFTEQARRAQLVRMTIESVAEHGYAGTSLARIAEAAGVTKAAVLYHYASKNDLVEAAHEHVLSALVIAVGEAVDAAAPAGRPAAYIKTMIGHLTEHPTHTRMIVEAMIHVTEPAEPSARWLPLARILAEAAGVEDPLELRHLAIATGGAIDAIVSERLQDAGYDTAAAAAVLVTTTEQALGLG